MSMIPEERIQEIINSFHKANPDLEKTASQEEADAEELLSELEKIAEATPPTPEQPETKNTPLTREQLKAMLLREMSKENPSPQFEALKRALLEGDNDDEVVSFIRSLV